MKRNRRYGSLAAKVYQGLIDPLLSPLRPRVVSLCRELNVGRVLDIASGTGEQCRHLGRAGIRATGLDNSQDMIDLARSAGGRNINYICGSAYDIPFDDNTFDACLLILALHEHTEKERTNMLREAVRVSRMVLLLADYQRPDRSITHVPWLAIRFVERCAGVEHHRGFVNFIDTGCLSGLAERHHLPIVRRADSHFGSIELATVSTEALTSGF